MSLLIDALKKAEQIKKAPPIWQEKKTSSPPNSYSLSSLTTAAGLSDETFEALQAHDNKSNHHENTNHDTVEKVGPNEPNELLLSSSSDEDFLITEDSTDQATFNTNESDLGQLQADNLEATVALIDFSKTFKRSKKRS